jgi:FdhD protein
MTQTDKRMVKPYLKHRINHWSGNALATATANLIGEEPLSIRVQGKTYAVIMRTPGDEMAHAAGFCLTEGIIDSKRDVSAFAACDGSNSNVVTITLTPERRNRVANVLDRRAYISQTSCGICGQDVIKDLQDHIPTLADGPSINIQDAYHCIEGLAAHQSLRRKTLAAHAAAIYDHRLDLLTVAEDVGRHNALDKAIGKLLLADRLEDATALVLSSRTSYELIQKSARARIPIVLSVSRPSALAVQLASRLHTTLACLSRDDGLYIFTGNSRLLGSTATEK